MIDHSIKVIREGDTLFPWEYARVQIKLTAFAPVFAVHVTKEGLIKFGAESGLTPANAQDFARLLLEASTIADEVRAERVR